MRLLLILLLILTYCPIAKADPSKKFDFLISFFDMNEAAFAYHRHCLNSEQGGINENFLRTLEFVADELFAEAVKNAPQTDTEYIKSKILKRRYNIQYNLDHAHMKEGCNSSNIDMAREHYKKFSQFNIMEVKKYIDE